MKLTTFLSVYFIVLAAVIAADTNSPATNAPARAPSTNATPAEVKSTNAPVTLQAPKDFISKTDTNGLVNLPIVQQMINESFQLGISYGITAAIKNQTLPQMGDSDALFRAAMFLRFGVQPSK